MGSRRGADLEHVADVLNWLRQEHPDAIVVSGGASDVDTNAEQNWLQWGGVVHSYRAKQQGPEEYVVEFWVLGGDQPSCFVMASEPVFADRTSALLYRDMLIAEDCDRLIAFYRWGKSPGTSYTAEWARHYGKKVYEYEAERIAA